jgi:hypothetical protein
MLILALSLFSLMTELDPIASQAYLGESASVTEARYMAFAANVATVALDPREAPVFDGDDGRERTARLLVSLWHYESHGRADAMLCDVGGDDGHSWGSFQVQRRKAQTCESYAGAAHVALGMIRESFALTGDLRLYTDGPAYRSDRARRRSHERMALATRP